MFFVFSASLILCGAIAATSDFPDFLKEIPKELGTSGMEFVAKPIQIGDKPCQMEVTIVKQLNGYCSSEGFGGTACVTDTHIEPFHHGCMLR